MCRCGARRSRSLYSLIVEAESGESPWAGSLRHVNDKPRRSQKHEEREDDKGSAPWMGTLRHVVHDNKVKLRL